MGSRVQEQRARGRRVLLWAGALFLAVQLSAGIWLDYYGLPIRFSEAARVLRAMRALPTSPDVVVFGSSRFERGVDAQITADCMSGGPVSVFNSAVPAGDLVVMDFLFEQSLRLGIRPAVVVIEISPETLSDHSPWMAEHLRANSAGGNVPAFS